MLLIRKFLIVSLALAINFSMDRSVCAQGPRVEIQINEIGLTTSPDIPNDDYVTWAPTFCRARLVDGTENITVVLTNDHPAYYLFVGGDDLPGGKIEIGDRFYCFVNGEELRVDAAATSPQSVAVQIAAAWNASALAEFGRFDAVANDTAVVITAKSASDTSRVTVGTYESDGAKAEGQTFILSTVGDVLFAEYQTPWPVNTTATDTTLQLENLNVDGMWQPFVIAGKFGRPSVFDKDAVIVVHRDTATGPVVGEKSLMVRVRKNANSLSEPERDKFLWAVKDLNRTNSGSAVGTPYRLMQEIHGRSPLAGDEGHGQAAFLPWHRALILQFERALQTQMPKLSPVPPQIPSPYSDYRSVTVPYHDWDAPAPRVSGTDAPR